MLRKIFKWVLWLAGLGFLLSIALVVAMRWVNPPTSMFMIFDRIANNRQIHYQWISIDKISPQLQLAVIAAEDQKFPAHFGFDFESIANALEEKRKKRRGASTISQQVAKNLFLWKGRSYFRKGLEAYLTVLIELFWSKQRILEVYLNIAEFGKGVYGAKAACQRYFDRWPANISRFQAATLAAVLPSPRRMSAGHPSNYVRRRASEIMSVMQELGGVQYLRQM